MRRRKRYMMYIRENFLPFTDKKVQEQNITNMEKTNSTRLNLEKMREKQALNKSKGRLFLEESAKIGREIKEARGGFSENFVENSQIEHNIYSRDNLFDSTREVPESMFDALRTEDGQFRKKKRRKFTYHFKQKRREHSESEEEESSEESTQDGRFQDWEDLEKHEKTSEFLKIMEDKDRLIRADHGERTIGVRYKTRTGREYRDKVEFMVDTIRDKLRFIENCT